MRTGVSYMGHHNPQHLETDIKEMKSLKLDDVLVAAQENDFAYFNGKLLFIPEIALDHGIRPLAIFWGALNFFGGGRSSQFLLEHPEGHQVALDGTYRAEGCYVNRLCVNRVKEMIDRIAELRFQGYFVDEPTPMTHCYCPSCRRAFYELMDGGDLATASEDKRAEFRRLCVANYVRGIADYCKKHYPHMETISCLMISDKSIWKQVADIKTVDNIGTDIYWVNEDNDVEEMVPYLDDLAALCTKSKKAHHEWLQCWTVRKGKENRILEQGRVLLRKKPDSLYVWAWKGQVGTTETCDDPVTSWQCACEILRLAKE